MRKDLKDPLDYIDLGYDNSRSLYSIDVDKSHYLLGDLGSGNLSVYYDGLSRGELEDIKRRVTDALHDNYCLDQCPLIRCNKNSKECLMKHINDALNG